MVVRPALWKGAAAVAARRPLADRALRLYYDGVVRSLAAALIHTGVLSVYAHGSYGTGHYRPGRSDVDIVAVLPRLGPEAELALLGRLRTAYRRHRAVLPIDLTPVPEDELGPTGGWYALLRPRLSEPRVDGTMDLWRLLAGRETRPEEVWCPDPRLSHLGHFHVENLLRHAGRPNAAARICEQLEFLDDNTRKEGIDWDAAVRLREARRRLAAGGRLGDAIDAVHAALGVEEERAARARVDREPTTIDGTDIEPLVVGAEAVSAGRHLTRSLGAAARGSLRSATVHAPPFESRPVLLLEAADAASARPLVAWALEHGGGASRSGLDIHVKTTLLAEGAWRTRLRWASLAAGGVPLAGEPLAPRVAPAPGGSAVDLGRCRTVAAVAEARWWAVGWPKVDVLAWSGASALPLRVATEVALARTGRLTTSPTSLARVVPELVDAQASSTGSLGATLAVWRASASPGGTRA